MAKLIGLVALAGAVAAGVFFWRRQGQPSLDSMWSSTEDSLTSWGQSAADEAGKAADKVAAAADGATSAATDLADEVKDVLGGKPKVAVKKSSASG
jgi:hypothetical protein